MTNQEIVMLMGIMASGKTTIANEYIARGYVHLNRDKMGGKIAGLVPHLETAIQAGRNVILDNTHPTVNSRKQFIDVAKTHNIPIRCVHLNARIEDAQFNASIRMIERRGKILSPEELSSKKDPNIFPPSVLFFYAKSFEPPTTTEGFSTVDVVPFVRKVLPEYTTKAIVLDYDGTLRLTKSGAPYPTDPDDIYILPNRIETLQRYKDKGYLLLGVSNQSGVAKGSVSNGAVRACFERTNQLLGHQIDYVYCPHQSNPIVCYCRKPFPAAAAWFIHKYKLSASDCIFVGDQTSDKTFAARSGFQYMDQANFFKG